MTRAAARKPVRKKRNILTRALAFALANPAAAAGGILSLVMGGAIATNALTMQPGAHPAPLFSGTRPVAPDETGALPAAASSAADDIDSILEETTGRRRPAVDTALVGAIQEALKVAGYYDGEIDGLPGPMTSAAILAFEKTNGLEPRGEPTAEILSALGVEDVAIEASPSPAPAVPLPRARPQALAAPADGGDVPANPLATRVAEAPPEAQPASPEAPVANDPPGDPLADLIAAPDAPVASAPPTPPERAEPPVIQPVAISPNETPAASKAVDRVEVAAVEPAAPVDRNLMRIQQALDLLGYGPLKADGYWTPETRAAIRRFEENRGLEPTGKISEAFLDELIRIGGLSFD